MEADGQLGRTHRYLWSDRVDEMLADEQNPTGGGWNTLWALSDHQGTVKDLLDYNPATGVSTLANSRTYDAFGNLESQSGSATTPFGYTGKYFDQVTGLQNNWNRWYSARQGRFISQDPIGFAGGDANLYRYVGNEATKHIDPWGLNDYDPNMPNWHHMIPQELRTTFGDSIDEAWNGHFLRAQDHSALHSAGWNDDWTKWVNEFKAKNLRAPNLVEAREYLEVLKSSEKYSSVLSRGFRAGWAHAEWSARSGEIKRRVGAALAKKLAKISGRTAAKQSAKGVLASVPILSIPFSLYDLPRRNKEFGTKDAMGMTLLDNIPLVDISLAITEGVDAIQQERKAAIERSYKEEQQEMIQLIEDAKASGEQYDKG